MTPLVAGCFPRKDKVVVRAKEILFACSENILTNKLYKLTGVEISKKQPAARRAAPSGWIIRWNLSDHNIFEYRLAVEHTNDTMAVAGIMFTVRYHDDGCTLFIQIRKKRHHFITV